MLRLLQRLTHRMCLVLGCIYLSTPSRLSGLSCEEQFTQIYEYGIWQSDGEGNGTSGSGSQLSTTEPYRHFLAEFLQENKIESVVDAGCGDWGFSHAIDWSGIDYRGFDIVQFVIDRNEMAFAQPNIRFFHTNMITTKLPKADLLICKDVLQHLPFTDVFKFVKQFSNYKYCLITNDVDSRTGSCVNYDADRGLYAYRNLDLTKPPFNCVAERVLIYDTGVATKLVLLITNDAYLNVDK